jgi:hypothetical protein
MNETLKIAAVVAAAAVVLPAVTAAQKVDQKLSLAASANVVKFGQELNLTGKLTGGTARDVSGQKVTLQRDDYPYEGTFGRVDTVETNDTGDYSFTLKPVANAKYRTMAKGGVESAELTVPVRVVVTLAVADKTAEQGTRVGFSGSVAPPHDGKNVKIQRRKPSGWKTISKDTLTDGGEIVSNYSKRVRIRRSGRYRVRFNPSDGDHVAGKSPAVRITVE